MLILYRRIFSRNLQCPCARRALYDGINIARSAGHSLLPASDPAEHGHDAALSKKPQFITKNAYQIQARCPMDPYCATFAPPGVTPPGQVVVLVPLCPAICNVDGLGITHTGMLALRVKDHAWGVYDACSSTFVHSETISLLQNDDRVTVIDEKKGTSDWSLAEYISDLTIFLPSFCKLLSHEEINDVFYTNLMYYQSSGTSQREYVWTTRRPRRRTQYDYALVQCNYDLSCA